MGRERSKNVRVRVYERRVPSADVKIATAPMLNYPSTPDPADDLHLPPLESRMMKKARVAESKQAKVGFADISDDPHFMGGTRPSAKQKRRETAKPNHWRLQLSPPKTSDYHQKPPRKLEPVERAPLMYNIGPVYIQSLVQAVKDGFKDYRAYKEAVRILADLSLHGDHQHRIFHEHDGLELFFGLVSSQDYQLRADAARAIGNVSANDEYHDLVVKSGGLPLLLELLASTDVVVQKEAMRAIAHLCTNDKYKGAILDSEGTLAKIFNLCQVDDPDVKVKAATALGHLLNRADGQARVTEEGGLQALSSLACCNQVEVQVQAARCFAGLYGSENAKVRQSMQQYMWQPLIYLARSLDIGVQKYAALALCNLQLADTEHAQIYRKHMPTGTLIETPKRLDVPQRHTLAKRDSNATVRPPKHMEEDGMAGQSIGGKSPSPQPGEKAQNLSQHGTESQAFSMKMKKQLKDYEMTVMACRRAGKTKMEGTIYHKMALLYETNHRFKKAIEYHKKALSICRIMNDLEGEAVAINNIAVDFQLMGPEHVKEALVFHRRHFNISHVHGKFMALCNIGLCYATMKRNDDAVKAFRHALRYALVLSKSENSVQEGLACGNLALIGIRQGDFATAQACMQRYLEIANMVGNHIGEFEGYKQLAGMAASRSNLAEATRCSEEALRAAKETHDSEFKVQAMLDVGVARGNEKFKGYMSKLAERFKPGTPDVT